MKRLTFDRALERRSNRSVVQGAGADQFHRNYRVRQQYAAAFCFLSSGRTRRRYRRDCNNDSPQARARALYAQRGVTGRDLISIQDFSPTNWPARWNWRRR